MGGRTGDARLGEGGHQGVRGRRSSQSMALKPAFRRRVHAIPRAFELLQLLVRQNPADLAANPSGQQRTLRRQFAIGNGDIIDDRRIGRIAGIDVSLHWTLLLLILFAGLSAPAGGALGTILLLVAVFGCVLLHELGHSLAARQFGIATAGIVLLPIGGVASLERMPRDPWQELWIAVAGPLVNVVSGTALLFALGPVAFLIQGGLVPSAVGPWLQYLLFANISLVVFNLLPAFPMDGGRVLRALLSMRMPYARATQTAARVGKFVAAAIGVVGLVYGQFMLLFIAAFVILAGSAEANNVSREAALGSADRSPPRWPTQSGRQVTVVWDEASRKYRVAGAG